MPAHTRPTPYKRAAQRAGATGLGAFTVLVVQSGLLQPTAADAAVPDEVWNAVAECESGGNPTAQNPNSTASGLYQIVDGTWRAYGGTEFAPRAKDASPEQQKVVAERILAGQGPQAWVDPCNDPFEGVDTTAPSVEEPAVPVQPETPPVEPPTVEQPAIPADAVEYVVVAGDTLHEIAAAHGTTVEGLAWLNGLDDPDFLYLGQRLLVPAAPETVHVVVPGDTLSQIALDNGYGMDWPTLWAENRDVVENPHLIYPDERIVVVVGGLRLLTGVPVPVTTPTPVTPQTQNVEPSSASTLSGYAHPIPGRTGIGEGVATGAYRGHGGQDFTAPLGTPIYAAHDGYVERVFDPELWNGGWGGGVELTAPDGTVTRYAHMSATMAVQGTFVLAGEQIGWSGSTGDSTGPHMHFEVLVGGVRIEPLPWLADRGITP